MREHKYRAWDTVRKLMFSAEEMGQDQEALLPDGRGFANISSTSTKLSQIHSHLLPLQYTGLKDKNGKEIYEGDIVKFTIPEDESLKTVCKIVWDDTGFYQQRIDNNRIMFIGGYEGVIEVIGNIYENPELMEK